MTSGEPDPVTRKALARVGSTLRGKWTLERLLGLGGMAAVYAASHRNGSRGAIKLLHLELSLDPEIRQRFLREAYLSNQVDHPGAVRVLDDDTAEDGSAFLVLELLQGESLDARLERAGGRLAVEEALRLLDQLLSTLVAAHRKGIVHRDIKPENLFLTTDGQLKLLDFGIARVRDASGASATRTGSTMGTPAFMPPEQALGRTREVGPASDLWAVGATLFTLLSGRFVHSGETANEVLVAAATQQAPSLGTVAPWVPPEVVVVVDQALAFRVEQRWPSATAMQHALRVAYHNLSQPVSSASTPFQDSPTVAASPLLVAFPRTSTVTTGSGSTTVRALLPPSASRPREWLRWGGAGLVLGGLVLGMALRQASPPVPRETVEAGSPPPAPSASEEPRSPTPTEVSTPGSASAPRAPVEPPGGVRVVVKGSACELLVDGSAAGRGEVFQLELTAGEHRLVCRAAGVAQERVLHVAPGAHEEVVFRMTAPSTKDPRDRRR